MPAPGTSGKMPDSRNTVTGVILQGDGKHPGEQGQGDHRQQSRLRHCLAPSITASS